MLIDALFTIGVVIADGELDLFRVHRFAARFATEHLVGVVGLWIFLVVARLADETACDECGPNLAVFERLVALVANPV